MGFRLRRVLDGVEHLVDLFSARLVGHLGEALQLGLGFGLGYEGHFGEAVPFSPELEGRRCDMTMVGMTLGALMGLLQAGLLFGGWAIAVVLLSVLTLE